MLVQSQFELVRFTGSDHLQRPVSFGQTGSVLEGLAISHADKSTILKAVVARLRRNFFDQTHVAFDFRPR